MPLWRALTEIQSSRKKMHDAQNVLNRSQNEKRLAPIKKLVGFVGVYDAFLSYLCSRKENARPNDRGYYHCGANSGYGKLKRDIHELEAKLKQCRTLHQPRTPDEYAELNRCIDSEVEHYLAYSGGLSGMLIASNQY